MRYRLLFTQVELQVSLFYANVGVDRRLKHSDCYCYPLEQHSSLQPLMVLFSIDKIYNDARTPGVL